MGFHSLWLGGILRWRWHTGTSSNKGIWCSIKVVQPKSPSSLAKTSWYLCKRCLTTSLSASGSPSNSTFSSSRWFETEADIWQWITISLTLPCIFFLNKIYWSDLLTISTLIKLPNFAYAGKYTVSVLTLTTGTPIVSWEDCNNAGEIRTPAGNPPLPSPPRGSNKVAMFETVLGQ